MDMFVNSLSISILSMLLCAVCLVDCFWSDWTDYGACSATCGTGNQMKVRVKILESDGGEPCLEEADVMNLDCNTDPCPGKMINLT